MKEKLLELEIIKIYNVNNLEDRKNERNKIEENNTNFEQDLADLSKDIIENGLNNPVHVYPLDSNDPLREEGYEYRIIAGTRRIKALKLSGTTMVSAFLHEEKENIVSITIGENLHRKNLSPLDAIEVHFKAIPFYMSITKDDAFSQSSNKLLKTGINIFRACKATDRKINNGDTVSPENIEAHIEFNAFLEKFGTSYSTLYRKYNVLSQNSVIKSLLRNEFINQTRDIELFKTLKKNDEDKYISLMDFFLKAIKDKSLTKEIVSLKMEELRKNESLVEKTKTRKDISTIKKFLKNKLDISESAKGKFSNRFKKMIEDLEIEIEKEKEKKENKKLKKEIYNHEDI